jgi:YHS domain-containing protein
MTKIILWLILIAFAIRAISRLVRGVLDGAGYRLSGGSPPGVALVRDPVCGMFVVPGQALQLGAGRDARYFCSEKCRREWTARPRG